MKRELQESEKKTTTDAVQQAHCWCVSSGFVCKRASVCVWNVAFVDGEPETFDMSRDRIWLHPFNDEEPFFCRCSMVNKFLNKCDIYVVGHKSSSTLPIYPNLSLWSFQRVESTSIVQNNKLTKLNAQHIYILFNRQIDIHAKEFGWDLFFCSLNFLLLFEIAPKLKRLNTLFLF